MSVMIENCLGIDSKCQMGMASLVLHYDTSNQNVCEAVGIGAAAGVNGGPVPLRPIVYVSPSYYHQRKDFYGDRAIVKPLLFEWRRLQAGQIKKLMRLDVNSTQLYIGVMLAMLRKYQRMNVIPSFASFCAELRGTFDSPSQSMPLNQRLMLLESLLSETEINAEFGGFCVTGGESDRIGHSIIGDVSPNQLIVVDLTDPLLSPDEAEGIFEVVLEDFQNCSVPFGKLVAIDEAHKYMSPKSGLSQSIVTLVRLMRHEGTRVLISTQSPMCLPVEVLELSSVVFIHRFHSSDWFEFLRKKIYLPPELMTKIRTLETGEAIVCESASNQIVRSNVRNRHTMDLGFSRS